MSSFLANPDTSRSCVNRRYPRCVYVWLYDTSVWQVIIATVAVIRLRPVDPPLVGDYACTPHCYEAIITAADTIICIWKASSSFVYKSNSDPTSPDYSLPLPTPSLCPRILPTLPTDASNPLTCQMR